MKKNFDDSVHLRNFAAKFANYDGTAPLFETPLQHSLVNKNIDEFFFE